jgi:geranylgeranyl diphosphate synthase, type II
MSFGAATLLIEADQHRALTERFRSSLPFNNETEKGLRGVLEDTLGHPGSLVRAQLIASALAKKADRDLVMSAAVAIEYFHSASLIFDDLPAMDDAEERRGRLCPHRVWGEGSAVLGALALVHQGYALIWQVLNRLPAARRARAAALVEDCLGVHGILNGQAHDLSFGTSTEAGDCRAVEKVALGKTVTLIRLTLLLPAQILGARPGRLRQFEALALAWGLAYQVLDDFKDCFGERAETGKSTQRDRALGRPNLIACSGPAAARARLTQLLADSRALIADLGADNPALGRLQDLLEAESAQILARTSA